MTPEEIRSNPACAEALAARDCEAIARIVSVGATRPNTREIGNGTILEVLGLEAGNNLLDVINNVPDFRHVKPLVEQGRLLIGSPLVQVTIQSLVPSVLTQPQANALCALGVEPHHYTAAEIAGILYNDDGSDK